MIEIEHLTKRYGAVTAVSDLSLTIDSGQIYGFLGPNGAGKSTTMNIMTGCLSATEGTVHIGGYDIFEEPRQAKKLISYLPEQPPLYLNESPLEYLRFVGEAKGLRGEELRQLTVDHTRAQMLLERGRITAEQAQTHPDRHSLTRAVGVEPTVDIAYSTAGLEPGDILLLCSDGLYNMLDPATLRACVRQAAAQDDGRCLMDAANARGGKDNITAVIIHYEENENG